MRNYTLLTPMLLFGLILPFLSFSQDLKIVYDAETGKMRYFNKMGEINKPIIKKGGSIVFTIENYNNYLYEVEFEETHETFSLAEGQGLLGGLEVLDLPSFINTPGFDFSDEDVDGVIDMFDREPDFELSEQQRRINELEYEAVELFENIKEAEAILKNQKSELVEIEDRRALRMIVLDEVDKIKYHPKISPTKIKTYSKAFFEKALDVSDINAVSLSSILEKKGEEKDLKTLLTYAVSNHSDYDENIDELKHIASELKSLNAMSSTPFRIQQKVLSAPGISGNMSALELEVESVLQEASEDKIQDLMEIWYEYEAISSNNFSTSFRAQGAGDVVNLNVSMLLKDSLYHTKARSLIQLAPIKVPVYGGIKINASVGVNFGQYFNRPQTYYLRDSTITGQSGDSFIPFITSLVHFYPQGRKDISIGGSLGIGIPLSGDESGFSSTTFFLGPSFFFGNSERLILNCGLMGGKVNRLSKGYKEGDFFDNDEDFIPVKSLYELGFFVGLSFNISR